jgi:class 3 adenylate cyclase
MPDRILDEPSDRTDWRAAPREWDDNHVGPGTDPPVAVAALQAPHQVIRTFAFLDLCGFTSYTDAHGPVAAYDLLVQFRALVREIAAKRGVRVAKWIGDGVLLVGILSAPVIATAVDVVARSVGGPISVRAGIATGPALLLDGDDYVGRSLNLASRLCDLGADGECLADADSTASLPSWVRAEAHPEVELKGIGRRSDLQSLRLAPGVPVPADPAGGR